ncbi:MAG: hypothetical protein Q4D62_03435 [Planctomycetia bacterium]|nr:hypothetical protein [Planctomycetia bacterium]
MIQRKLEETRQQIYWQEWATQLLKLSCWGTVFLGVVLLLDHWCQAGMAVRFTLWGLFWGGFFLFFFRNLLPLLRNRIHPLYAAHALERENPQLKNRLLNLLFLKKEPSFRKNGKRSAVILTSLEQQTLQHLSQGESSSFQGARHLLRQGIFLGILLLTLFFYTFFSPKSSWTSVKRVLFPWETIAAPTRVRLEEILPGNCTVLAGETLTISARIVHLRSDEKVTLLYSTHDRQVVNRTLPMKPLSEDRWEALLGDWPAGIQTPLAWEIHAGDAFSETFQVDVAPPLRMEVKEVILTPPAYMQLPVQKGSSPDFQGWEGTEATLQIQASHTIHEGYLEMWPEQNPSEKKRWKLEVAKQNPHQASVRVPLQFSPWNRPTAEEATPETFFYTLHFTHENHTSSPTPPQHPITVLPDRFPQIRLITFPEEGSVLPWGKSVEVVLEVEDTDFALRGVAFRARWNGKNLDIPPIFLLPTTETGFSGTFRTHYRWNPAEANLKPGDSIQWWVEAVDNRLPQANRAATPWRTLHWAELSEKQEENADSAENQENENQASGVDSSQKAEDSATQEDGREGSQEETQTGAEESPETSRENPEGEGEDETEAGEENAGTGNQEGEAEPNVAPLDFDPLSPENASSREVPSTDGEESSEEGEKNEEGNRESSDPKNDSGQNDSSQPSSEENPSQTREDGAENPSAGASPVSEETSPGEEESPDAAPQGSGEKETADSLSPEDARPGSEEGTSSQHDFSQPGGEKEDFQKENLRESENLHQKNRPGIVDNSSDGGGNAASQPKDGESDPGGVFEEILKHQDQSTGKGTGQESSAPPEKADEDGGDWEMENQEAPTPSENASHSQESGKSSQRSGNDTQKGNASSRPESMRDLSTEGTTRERDKNPGTQKGGQENSQQQGIGRAGNHTPNEEGNPSGSGGDGPLDSHGGEGQLTDEKTGFSNPQQAGNSDATRPSQEGSQKGPGNTMETSQSPSSASNPSSATAPSAQRSQHTERGSGWSDGKSDQPGSPDGADENTADQANAEYARQQTLLALNHLQDMLARGDETLLKQLGWSREEAMAFLQKWRQIHQTAEGKNLSTQQQRQLERTFRSLGLSPRRELEREAQQDQRKVFLHNTLQTPPPEKWRETLEAYSRGIAGEGSR